MSPLSRSLVLFALVGCSQAVDGMPLTEVDTPLAESPLGGDGMVPLPPPGVDLVLDATDVLPGLPTTLTVTHADPGETVHFLRNNGSVGQGPCPGALGGHCLELRNPVVHMGTAVADPQGVATYVFDVPQTAPMGRDLAFEAAVARGPQGVDSLSSGVVGKVVGEQSPYSYDIAVDGDLSDWDAGQHFFEPSGGRGAGYVSWNDTHLFIGMEQADIATGGGLHWEVLYLGSDQPGTTVGLTHATQQPALPFEASVAVRRKADGSYDSLETWDGQAWVGVPYWLGTEGSEVAEAGEALELALPLDLLGGATSVELVFMHLYEGVPYESTYSVVPSDAFLDGYDPDVATALFFDLTSPDAPVDQAL